MPAFSHLHLKAPRTGAHRPSGNLGHDHLPDTTRSIRGVLDLASKVWTRAPLIRGRKVLLGAPVYGSKGRLVYTPQNEQRPQKGRC